MTAEGVKTQYMQSHYMRPAYVKPYTPDVDLVLFSANFPASSLK
jgi:hypothetical protein